MKLCEFYRNQFETAKSSAKWFDEDSKILSEMYGKGTYKWFKEMANKYFGGAYDYQYTNSGITQPQLHEAKENGFVKLIHDSSWQARQLHQTYRYVLTEKGLKALFKAYENQW